MSPDKKIEIMPGIQARESNLSWFVGRMFNPESNNWVWIRRIANLLTFPIFVILFFKVLLGV